MVGEMFLDLGEVGTTWSKPVLTNSTKLVVIDETPVVNKQASPITTCLEKHHQDMSPSSAEQLLMSPTPLSHHACHMCPVFHDMCFFYFLLTTPLFFLSQRNLSFLHTMVVTRREKLFVLCTLRPPLPNWGLTRPPNMPKVSPVAHDDGLCTEDAPTGSPQIGAPPHAAQVVLERRRRRSIFSRRRLLLPPLGTQAGNESS